MYQAGVVAQCMFTLWDIGWDCGPYYPYTFSVTADTKQNFGLMAPGIDDEPARFSAAWKAYQTIAQTFYNRRDMGKPSFRVKLTQAERVEAADGTSFTIAPADPVLRAYVRDGGQLLIYLAYRHFREPREGRWNVVLETDDWGGPQQIPLLDYKARIELSHHQHGRSLVIEDVLVGLQPVIITLRQRPPAG